MGWSVAVAFGDRVSEVMVLLAHRLRRRIYAWAIPDPDLRPMLRGPEVQGKHLT